MAIFDPPDGSIDPRPRCTGNCCKCFSIEQSYETVLSEAAKTKSDANYHSTILAVETIAAMLIPLGVARRQEIFTCKHLGESGNCQIYEMRPPMCRDFPGANPCPYRNCASHGPQGTMKKFWNWVRD